MDKISQELGEIDPYNVEKARAEENEEIAAVAEKDKGEDAEAEYKEGEANAEEHKEAEASKEAGRNGKVGEARKGDPLRARWLGTESRNNLILTNIALRMNYIGTQLSKAFEAIREQSSTPMRVTYMFGLKLRK